MSEQDATAHDEQLVVFLVGGESYGVAIADVQEIIRTPAITAVPRAPEHVAGVINLRGRVIPVIDLRKRFRLPPADAGRDGRVVVINVSGEIVGATVDSVSEVLRVPAEAIVPPAPTLGGSGAHIRGIAQFDERLIVLLDLDRVLEPPQIDLDAFEAVA